MSSLTDLLNAGLENKAKVLVSDPVGKFGGALDQKLSGATKAIGSVITSVLGERLADLTGDATKAAAADARQKTTPAVEASDVMARFTGSSLPILAIVVFAILLWKNR